MDVLDNFERADPCSLPETLSRRALKTVLLNGGWPLSSVLKQ
jgi:hypothetical protein